MSVLLVIKYLAFAEQHGPETAALMGASSLFTTPEFFYRISENLIFVIHFVARGFRKCEPPCQIRPCRPGWFCRFLCYCYGFVLWYDECKAVCCKPDYDQSAIVLFDLELDTVLCRWPRYCGVCWHCWTARRSAQWVHVQTAERTGSFSRVCPAS